MRATAACRSLPPGFQLIELHLRRPPYRLIPAVQDERFECLPAQDMLPHSLQSMHGLHGRNRTNLGQAPRESRSEPGVCGGTARHVRERISGVGNLPFTAFPTLVVLRLGHTFVAFVEQGIRRLFQNVGEAVRTWSWAGRRAQRTARAEWFLPPTTHCSVFEPSSSAYINAPCEATRRCGNMRRTKIPRRALSCIRHKVAHQRSPVCPKPQKDTNTVQS